MNISDITKRVLLPVIMLLMTGVHIFADDNITFTAQAPQAVVLGDRFRITYKVNTRDVKEFRAPDMKSIQIITGPATSTSSSTTIMNGKVESSTTITYTYTAVATEEGEVQLDGATIRANGKQKRSCHLIRLRSRAVRDRVAAVRDSNSLRHRAHRQ